MNAVVALPPAEGPPSKHKLALIVDDDPIICAIASDLLVSAGFKTFCILDGGEAIAAIWDHDPDVAVIDVILPHTTGMEVLKRVRSSGVLRSLPIVMMSGCYGSRPAEQAMRAGANAFLRKPFDHAAFVTQIVRAANRPVDRKID
ncbi:MAG: response regulator [Sphingomonas bacterium]|nr:response regulator [Sphingomonas bacterium]